MPSPFHPEWLYCSWTSLVHRQAVGEIDHLIFGTMDHQHRRGDFRYLVNAGEGKGKHCSVCGLIIHARSAYQCLFLTGCKTLELCPNNKGRSLLPKCMCKMEPTLPLLSHLQLWWPEAPMCSGGNQVWHLNHQWAVHLSQKPLRKPTERQMGFNEMYYQRGYYALSPSNVTD